MPSRSAIVLKPEGVGRHGSVVARSTKKGSILKNSELGYGVRKSSKKGSVRLSVIHLPEILDSEEKETFKPLVSSPKLDKKSWKQMCEEN